MDIKDVRSNCGWSESGPQTRTAGLDPDQKPPNPTLRAGETLTDQKKKKNAIYGTRVCIHFSEMRCLKQLLLRKSSFFLSEGYSQGQRGTHTGVTVSVTVRGSS